MSQNTILSIAQDQKGFMWFGTQGGVNRYDGYTFKTYRYDPNRENSISDDFVYAIQVNPNGSIWFGTGHGLNHFDPVKEHFTHYLMQEKKDDALKCNYIKTLYRDPDGVLWIGTWGAGLSRFHPENQSFTHYTYDERDRQSISHNQVTCITSDNHGYLWIGTASGGLNRLDPKTGKFNRFSTASSTEKDRQNQVLSIISDKNGMLWMGTWNEGIVRFNPSTNEFTRFQHQPGNPSSLSDNMVFALMPAPNGELWAGTRNGLNLFNTIDGTFTRYYEDSSKPGSLSESRILSLYQDRNGDIWIGTSVSGINRLDGAAKEFNLYRKESGNPEGLSSNNVYAFHEDPDKPDILWIGTRGGGLNRFNRRTGKFKCYTHDKNNAASLGHNEVHVIKRDGKGIFWIGTFGGGLYQFLEEREEFIAFRKRAGESGAISGDYISFVFEDLTGNLWVGTMDGGLNRFHRNTRRFTHFISDPEDPFTLSSDFTRAIVQARPGILWIGTQGGGLNRFDKRTGSFTHYMHVRDNIQGISHNIIMSLYLDKSGNFWIGTAGGGLNQFFPATGRFKVYTSGEGLPDNTVYGILEDGTGCLWLSTNKGISKFDPTVQSFKNYDVQDGLQSNEFNFNASLKSSRGEMIFGGVNGFNTFFPHRIKDNTVKPPVLITDLKLFNQSVPVGPGRGGRTILNKSIMDTEELRLCYDDYVISFDYTALNYRFSNKNQYAYIMEGFDKQWNQVGNRRFASYTNLPPGEYTFRVKASNNDGIWNEKGRSLKIIVTPPFWLTWWFAPSMFLLAVSFFISLHRLKLRKQKIINRRLEEEVNRRTREAELARFAAEEANKSKSQFLASMSHEIRTPLNGVIGFVDLLQQTRLSGEQEDFVESLNTSAKALLSLVDDILDFSKIEAGHMILDESPFSLETMVKEVIEIIKPKIEDKPIAVKGTVEADVPDQVIGDMSRFRQVLINLMGNAAKFTGEGEITLHIMMDQQDPGRLKLHTRVSDTGIGIPKEKLGAVFDLFRQADGSTTRHYGGSGLGLSISRQIAHLMDGNIWAISEPGKGSAFHFTAWVKHSGTGISSRTVPVKPPCAEITPSKGVASQPEQKEKVNGGFILLVEDNALNQKLAQYMLNYAGYSVELAVNGKQGVEMFTGNPNRYNLILMDIQMPEMDGIQATRLIRERGFTEIPIIAMTAQALKSEREKCLDSGMNDFISKPIKRNAVFQTLEKWL